MPVPTLLMEGFEDASDSLDTSGSGSNLSTGSNGIGQVSRDTSRSYQGAASLKCYGPGGGSTQIARLSMHPSIEMTANFWQGFAVYLPVGFYVAQTTQVRLMSWSDSDAAPDFYHLRGSLYIDSADLVVLRRSNEKGTPEDGFYQLISLGSRAIPEGQWTMIDVHWKLSPTDGVALSEVYFNDVFKGSSTLKNIQPQYSANGLIDQVQFGMNDNSSSGAVTLWVDRCYASTTRQGTLTGGGGGGTPPPTPPPDAKTAGISASDVSVATTASVAYTGSRWLWAWVASRRNDGSTPDVPTSVTDTIGNLTWTQAATVTDITTGSDRRRINLYYARITAGATGTITFTFPAIQRLVDWSILEQDGLDGQAPVAQVATASSATAVLSGLVTLPAPFGHPSNDVLGGIINGIAQAITPGSGFVERHEEQGFNLTLQTQGSSDPDPSVDWTWTTTATTYAAIAVETRAFQATGGGGGGGGTGQPGVVTQTVLAQGTSVADQTALVTPSVTPTGDRWLILKVGSRKNTGTAADLPSSITSTITPALTWTQVGTVVDLTTGTDQRRKTWYRAKTGATPTAGTVTMTFPSAQRIITYALTQLAGADATNPFSQVVTASSLATVTSGSVTLAAFADSANATLASVLVGAQAEPITPGAGFTEIAEQGAFNASLEAEFVATNNTVPSWTWTTPAVYTAIAAEVKAAVPTIPPVGFPYLEGFESGGDVGFFASVGGFYADETTTVYEGTHAEKFTITGSAGGIARLNRAVYWDPTIDIYYGCAVFLPTGFYAAANGQVRLMGWTDYDEAGTLLQYRRGGVWINGTDDNVHIFRHTENSGAANEQTSLLNLGYRAIGENAWHMVEVHQALQGSAGRTFGDGLFGDGTFGGGAVTEAWIDGVQVGSTVTTYNINATVGFPKITRMRWGFDDALAVTNPVTIYVDRAYIDSSRLGPSSAALGLDQPEEIDLAQPITRKGVRVTVNQAAETDTALEIDPGGIWERVHDLAPEIAVEIAAVDDPADVSPTWVNVTDRVRTVSTRVYRQRELDDFETGELFVTLDNRDRALEPGYASAALAPAGTLRRRIRYRVRHNGVVYTRFVGFIRDTPISWEPRPDATVTIKADDYGLVLNRGQVTISGYPEELAHLRIGRVLDAMSIPTADRAIDTSDHTVAAIPAAAEGEEPLTVGGLGHVSDAAKSDGGYLFIARDGKITFHNRRRRLDSFGTPVGTFGDTAGETPYLPSFTGQMDDSNLWNRIAVLTAAGAREELRDTASSNRHWDDRKDDFQSQLAKPGEAAALASLALWRYKDGRLRFPAVNMLLYQRGEMTSARIAVILAATVGTRITVKRRPPGGGAVISQDAHVEGISEDVSPGSFSMSFSVSPADPAITEWVVGTSALGTNTYVGV